MDKKIDAQNVIKALQAELSEKQLENAVLKAQLVAYQQAEQKTQKPTEKEPAKEDVEKPEEDKPAQLDPNFDNKDKDGE